MTRAVAEFVNSLVVHFGEPKFDAPEENRKKVYAEWLASMKANLQRFPDGALAKAAELIIAKRKYRNFPLVSECLDACDEAERLLKAERPRLIGTQPVSKGASNDDRERLAYELILGAMGKRADRENWIGMLFTYTRDNMRLPQSDAEINHLILQSRLADKDYEKLLRNDYDIHPENALQWTKMRGALIRGWEGRFARRQSLGEYVRTGVLP